jgi:hypothetical protein
MPPARHLTLEKKKQPLGKNVLIEGVLRLLDLAVRNPAVCNSMTATKIYPRWSQVVGISMRHECREQGAKVPEYL